jgi:hypothetical protein
MDTQPDDEVRHRGRAGTAERLAPQACGPGAQRQVLPRNVLRVALARFVLFRSEMTRVHAPGVRIIARDAKRFQPGLALEAHRIVATPQDELP